MKKRILGLAVIIGVILALSASAFAATSIYTPKFTTSKLSDATAGKTYSQNIVVEVSSSDADWTIEITSPTYSTLESTYNLTMNDGTGDSKSSMTIKKGTTKGTFILKSKGSDPVFRDTKSLALKFKALNGNQQVEKEYKLKIVGTAPAFTSPSDADLGKTFFTSNNASENWNKSGVGVVGRAFPTGDKAIKIQAGTGTLPIKMTATGLVAGLTAAQTYGSTDKNVTDARGATTHTGSNIPAMTITGTPTKAGKMSVKVTAANETKSTNGTYTLTILDSPDITTAKLTDATYGKAYKVKLAGKGGDKDYPLKWYAAAADDGKFNGLPKGFTINSATGEITGTASKDAVAFKAGSADATYNVTVKAISYADPNYADDKIKDAKDVAVTKTLPLKVKANKPVFISADTFKGNTLVLSASQTLTQSLAKSDNSNFAPVVNGSNMFIYVDTAAKFTIKGLPAGWEVAMNKVVSTDTATAENLKKGRGSYITFTGSGLTASTPVKSGKIDITATNGAGSTKLTIPYKVDAAKPKIASGATAAASLAGVSNGTVDTLKNASSGVLVGTGKNSKKLNTEIKQYLTATPGPIKWKAVKLPKGLTLKASGDTQATLTGKFTKEQEPTEWSITATNSVTSYTAVVSGEIAIYTSPDIKTKKLGKATAGKHYTAKVDVKGTDAVFTEAKLKVAGVDNDTNIFGPANKNAAITIDGKTYGNISFLSDDNGKCFVSADFTRLPTKSIAVYMKAANPAGLPDEVTLSIDVAGVKPKITTSKVYDGTNGAKLSTSSNAAVVASIDVTGTDPMSFRAYVTSKDAKKLGFSATETWILLNQNTWAVNTANGVVVENSKGFKAESVDTAAGMTIKLAANPAFAAKGLPITVEVTNPAADGKWTKKAYKIDVAGGGVGWKYLKATAPDTEVTGTPTVGLPANSKDITVYGTAGLENKAFVILAMSGDKPWVVTTKPTSGDTDEKKGNVNGISVKGTGSTVTIYGTPTAGKETKTKIPVTLTNPLTKAKRAVNVNVIAYMPPIINSKDTKVKNGGYNDKIEVENLVGYANVEIGKKVNIKLSTKAGSKTGLSWDITKASGVKGVDSKAKFLSVLGLTFDREKGTITGIPKVTTSGDNKSFTPLNLKVKAANVAGESAEGNVVIMVTGKKFKIDTKNSKLKIYNAATNNANVGQIITSLNDEKISKDIVFELQENAELPEGVALDKHGKITVTEGTAASKGETIKFQADNVGTVVKGSVKIVIYDPAPKVTLSVATVSLTASSADKDEKTLTATATNVTGDTKITWKVQRPDGVDSKIKVAVKADTSDKSGKSATVTVTLPKNYNGDEASNKVFKIVATNSLSKEVGSAELTLSATTLKAALPENKSALPEDEELTEEAEETTEEAAEETEEVKAEASITFGEARTEASLTAGQRAAIEEEGYIIAAVLPEMSVTESGQYDIEAELSEKAPEGAKLVWFAFPKDVEPSDDDKIADFFDEEGAEIDAVPASRKIVVSPWLEAEITYAPVIVVKAEDTAGAKDTLEGAEAGDVVTEEALAEAEAVSPDETAPSAE